MVVSEIGGKKIVVRNYNLKKIKNNASRLNVIGVYEYYFGSNLSPVLIINCIRVSMQLSMI